jgi:hypothetical protein
MSCRAMQDQLPSLLEGDVSAPEAHDLQLHLGSCEACSSRMEALRRSRVQLTALLRTLPVKQAPQELSIRLRVAASYEIERTFGRGDFSSSARRWWTRVRLSMRDLMRPLALPAAGGLLSSVASFTMLASTLTIPQQVTMNDIPLVFTTQVQVDELSPFGFTGHDVVMELTIDKHGKVANYAAHGEVTRADMRELGNLILFTSFAPATVFGQPTSGKILLKSHRINVRG